jgi:N-acetylglucosaminyldiphosphoundecaprenol N-acetyl-beta-D-mannosaminyltransferase
VLVDPFSRFPFVGYERKNFRILGIDFFRGSIEEAVIKANGDGLCVAPSGPGLAGDLTNCTVYSRALTQADLVLPDSGLMCLWTKFFSRRPIKRISGLAFLKAYLFSKEFRSGDSTFWIMPDEEQSATNRKWLKEELGLSVQDEAFYVAPRYAKVGPIEDLELLATIIARKPRTIFIQLGGGVQERLGLFLRNKLSFPTTILCTGAALAFLSGEQVKIPNWADRLYLGWLLRCCAKPTVFVPRYLNAFRLIGVLAKNGENLPKVSASQAQD